MLVDAGPDTNSPCQLMLRKGSNMTCTPLSLTNLFLREKAFLVKEDLTEEEFHRLEAIRLLLVRVDAIRAVSWLWPNAVLHIPGALAELAGK